MNKSVAQQNKPRKENDDFLKVQKTHSDYNECISLQYGTTGNRRHHMHLKLFNVSLLFRKLFPLLNFLSTEWKAAFGGRTMYSPNGGQLMRQLIYYHVLWLSLCKDCWCSHYKMFPVSRNTRVTFCFHNSKTGCEIYYNIL